MELARFEKDIGEQGDTPLSLQELLLILGDGAQAGATREDAIARYLAGADGWREAARMLGGAFAEAAAAGLKERKVD